MREAPGRDFVTGFLEAIIVRACILASSSSGNATFIGTGRTRILVDAGLSRKAIFERLKAIGEDPHRLDAVLVTHEHSDHVSGLGLLSRTLQVPVYITRPTAATIDWKDHQPRLAEFQAGESFRIGDIRVESFTIPHDAADPVGYCFHAEGHKMALATDLGYLPQSVKYHLRDTELLMLEANHDLEMLKVGPYPWAVKQRVMSRHGHLSNAVASEFIAAEMSASTRILVLGHLSENNNHPEIVRVAAQQALDGRGLSTRLVVAEPRQQTEVFRL